MRAHGFGATLVFGAVASAGLLAGAWLLVPPLSGATFLGLYLVATVCAYATALAPDPRRGAASFALAAALGAAVLALAGRPSEVAIGAALVLAVCRSGFLYRSRPLRALALEVALAGGGLALARFLATGGLAGAALALWGFFVVQSGFFLAGGVRPRRAQPEGDPFDEARARLLVLLGEEGAPSAD